MLMGAGRLGWAAKQVQALAAELVEGLSGLGRPSDAATVAATHLHDFDTAVHLFSQAHEWRQVCLSLHEDGCSPDGHLRILDQPLITAKASGLFIAWDARCCAA